MQAQTADVIDFQAYRQSRIKPHPTERAAVNTASFVMQPVMMFLPFWGFVPVMTMGVAGYGV